MGKKEGTNRFLCNQWEWWVIYPNSTKLGFSGVPPEVLHEKHGVGACSTVFLEQMHGGAAAAGCVWLTIFGAELFFWIWSCVELCQTPQCHMHNEQVIDMFLSNDI
jgi:hypothetical protein